MTERLVIENLRLVYHPAVEVIADRDYCEVVATGKEQLWSAGEVLCVRGPLGQHSVGAEYLPEEIRAQVEQFIQQVEIDHGIFERYGGSGKRRREEGEEDAQDRARE